MAVQADLYQTRSEALRTQLKQISWVFGDKFKDNEPHHRKTFNVVFAPSKDSDQPGCPPSLISLHCPNEVSLGPMLSSKCTGMTDQTGRMPSLIIVILHCLFSYGAARLFCLLLHQNTLWVPEEQVCI